MKHIRIYDQQPRETFLSSLGFFALMAIFSGALFWGLTTSLDDMTQRDCDFGVQAACEDLRK
mgnify:CR=1 FL=1